MSIASRTVFEIFTGPLKNHKEFVLEIIRFIRYVTIDELLGRVVKPGAILLEKFLENRKLLMAFLSTMFLFFRVLVLFCLILDNSIVLLVIISFFFLKLGYNFTSLA
jgi:hypothetical protein